MKEIQINGLYGLFLRRINEIRRHSKSVILPFPVIFQKLCACFSITKKECWEVLFIIRDAGFIEIVPFHGIKLKEQVSLS